MSIPKVRNSFLSGLVPDAVDRPCGVMDVDDSPNKSNPSFDDALVAKKWGITKNLKVILKDIMEKDERMSTVHSSSCGDLLQNKESELGVYFRDNKESRKRMRCNFCGTTFIFLIRHLEKVHRNEPFVKVLLQSKSKKQMFNLLSKMPRETMRVERKHDTNYLEACSMCEEIYDIKVFHSTGIIFRYKAKKRTSASSSHFYDSILRTLCNDALQKVIIKSNLIQICGKDLYESIKDNFSPQFTKTRVISYMRHLAKLFLYFLDNLSSHMKFEDIFSVSNYLLLKQAICFQMKRKRFYSQKPMKDYVNLIKRACHSIIRHFNVTKMVRHKGAIIEFVDHLSRTDCNFKAEWKSQKDNSLVNTAIELRKFIVDEFHQLLTPNTVWNKENYERLKNATLVRIAFFNRYSASVIGKVRNSEWKEAVDKNDLESLSYKDGSLLNEFKLVTITSKMKRDAILVPRSCFKSLDVLSSPDIRKLCNVSPYNLFIFASTNFKNYWSTSMLRYLLAVGLNIKLVQVSRNNFSLVSSYFRRLDFNGKSEDFIQSYFASLKENLETFHSKSDEKQAMPRVVQAAESANIDCPLEFKLELDEDFEVIPYSEYEAKDEDISLHPLEDERKYLLADCAASLLPTEQGSNGFPVQPPSSESNNDLQKTHSLYFSEKAKSVSDDVGSKFPCFYCKQFYINIILHLARAHSQEAEIRQIPKMNDLDRRSVALEEIKSKGIKEYEICNGHLCRISKPTNPLHENGDKPDCTDFEMASIGIQVNEKESTINSPDVPMLLKDSDNVSLSYVSNAKKEKCPSEEEEDMLCRMDADRTAEDLSFIREDRAINAEFLFNMSKFKVHKMHTGIIVTLYEEFKTLKDVPFKQMFDLRYFDILISCLKKLTDKHRFRDIIECIKRSSRCLMCVYKKRGNKELRLSVVKFMVHLMELEGANFSTCNSNIDIIGRQAPPASNAAASTSGATPTLTPTADIQKLTKFIADQRCFAYHSIRKSKWEFALLRRVTHCRIGFLNRMSLDEVTGLTVNDWQVAKGTSSFSKKELSNLTQAQQRALGLFFIVNQTSRPILIHKSAFKALDMLSDDKLRKAAGIESNLLFPHFCGEDPITLSTELLWVCKHIDISAELPSAEMMSLVTTHFYNLYITPNIERVLRECVGNRPAKSESPCEISNKAMSIILKIHEILKDISNIDLREGIVCDRPTSEEDSNPRKKLGRKMEFSEGIKEKSMEGIKMEMNDQDCSTNILTEVEFQNVHFSEEFHVFATQLNEDAKETK